MEIENPKFEIWICIPKATATRVFYEDLDPKDFKNIVIFTRISNPSASKTHVFTRILNTRASKTRVFYEDLGSQKLRKSAKMYPWAPWA